MVTIKDVAREAGVAISTVSNVFNNGDIVSEETKQKVLEAVEKLQPIICLEGTNDEKLSVMRSNEMPYG